MIFSGIKCHNFFSFHHLQQNQASEPLYQEVTNGGLRAKETTQVPHYQSPTTCPHYHVLENQNQRVPSNPSTAIYDQVSRERSDQTDGNTSRCSSSGSPPPIPPHYSTRGIPPQLQSAFLARESRAMTLDRGTSVPRCLNFSDFSGPSLEYGRSLTPNFEQNRRLLVQNGRLHTQRESSQTLSRDHSVDNRPAGCPRRNRSNSDSLMLLRVRASFVV